MGTRKNALLAVAISAALSAVALTTHSAAANDDDALARYQAAERIGQEHLKKFDTLDFDIYTNQKW